MTWQILILGHALIVSLSMLAMRALAKQNSTRNLAFVANAGMFGFLYITGLVILPFLGPIDYSVLWTFLPLFCLGGIAFALSNSFQYKVLSHLDAGITGVLSTLGALFTIILAAAVLHEDLSSSQAIGAFILLAAVCYILTVARQPGKHRLQRSSWIKGLTYAVIGSIFIAIAMVNEKFLLGKMPASSYILFGWGAQTAAIFIAAALFQRKDFRYLLKPRVIKLVGFGGIARGLSGYIFILALLKSNNVALMSVVANVKLIFIVLLGAWLLHEKQKLTEKLTAAFLAMAGLAVIFWK